MTTEVATTPTRTRTASVLAVLIMIAGGLLAAAGVGTWAAVQTNLAQEKIVVSDDAPMFAGETVNGPLTAFVQAEVINTHYLDATEGKTYAELDRDDPLRQVAMNASFLRASLFTSVVAFGVAALSTGLGIVLVLTGTALRSLARR